MKLGTESRGKTIGAAVLGALALIVLVYRFVPMFSESSATPVSASQPVITAGSRSRPVGRRIATSTKKGPAQPNLDPTLQLQLLAASEQTKYEGSGRNIFVSQAEVIPQPKATGATDVEKPKDEYHLPSIPQQPPIPLKFFGFASQPGEPKKIFLSKGEDVFIAGEGEIVDRRYKVLRISPTSVEVQDLVGSGPPQHIQLTQG